MNFFILKSATIIIKFEKQHISSFSIPVYLWFSSGILHAVYIFIPDSSFASFYNISLSTLLLIKPSPLFGKCSLFFKGEYNSSQNQKGNSHPLQFTSIFNPYPNFIFEF